MTNVFFEDNGAGSESGGIRVPLVARNQRNLGEGRLE